MHIDWATIVYYWGTVSSIILISSTYVNMWSTVIGIFKQFCWCLKKIKFNETLRNLSEFTFTRKLQQCGAGKALVQNLDHRWRERWLQKVCFHESLESYSLWWRPSETKTTIEKVWKVQKKVCVNKLYTMAYEFFMSAKSQKLFFCKETSKMMQTKNCRRYICTNVLSVFPFLSIKSKIS